MRRYVLVAVCLAALGTVAVVNAQEMKTVWTGAFSDKQADRGAQVYQKKCTVCHSDNFRGNVDGGPPLKGPDFEQRWAGLTMKDIVDQVSSLMPATEPGSLSRQDYVDVLAFLFRANGAKMADADLKADDELLE